MTADELRKLKGKNRVCWRGNANDGGTVSAPSWYAVTIEWDNEHVATVHHGGMHEVHPASVKPRRVK